MGQETVGNVDVCKASALSSASFSVINVFIYIDTESLLKKYPNPSKDQNNPTGIDHNQGYMFVTGATNVKSQGTGDLEFTAKIGDFISMYAASSTDNFDDAVLLYGIKRFSGDNVLSDFTNNVFTRKVPIPSSSSSSVLPARIVDRDFWSYDARVQRAGREGYMVKFALYTRDGNGQISLKGYYCWDPYINVVN
ncbi:MAG: inclusion body family protein [Defluviitaleaceae bacterium]|nr:inclusion body family protein [Defluviitaleaceae bacterium]